MLLRSFAGITNGPLEWVYGEDKTVDIDAMLSKVPGEAWLRPTYEELIITDGSQSLDVLLDDVSDYATAIGLVQDVTMPNRGRAGSLAGKTRTAFVEP